MTLMSEPTHILSTTVRGTTVVTKLYGTITKDRLEFEQRQLQHRAEQLAVPTPERQQPRSSWRSRVEAREEFDESPKSRRRRARMEDDDDTDY